MHNYMIDRFENDLIELESEMLDFTSGGTSSFIDPLGGTNAGSDKGIFIDPNG